MRVVITAGNLMVSLMLIIVIHTSLIGQNVRDNEVNASLNSSMDYAFDKMNSYHSDEKYKQYFSYDASTGNWIISDNDREKIEDDLMTEFCLILSAQKKSDADISVELINIDISKGIFEVKVTEKFPYYFGNKTGKCSYQKSYKFS